MIDRRGGNVTYQSRRYWNDAVTSQGMLADTRSRKARKELFPRDSRGSTAQLAPDFGLLASRTVKGEIVWLSTTKFILTCCSTHRKLIQEGCSSTSGKTPSCLRISLGP